MSSVIKIEDVKRAIHRVDLLMRPYVVFMHPDDYENIVAMYPDFETDYQVEKVAWQEKGKCVLMKREELEKWAKPRFDGLFEEQQGENTQKYRG